MFAHKSENSRNSKSYHLRLAETLRKTVIPYV